MKIQSVQARTVAIPLERPTRIARRALPVRYYTLVRVTTDAGLEGIGFCLAGRPATVIVREMLAPLLVGEDPHATERLWERMYWETLLLGRRGAAVRAISAVDIALWDIKAKAAGVPLGVLLGAYRDRVPAYASGGYYVEGQGLEDLAREVSSYVEMGFRAVKIKVGGVPLEEDVERVRVAREAAGSNVLLMLDANNAWRDVPTALRAIRRFEEYDIAWIEEPLSPDDVEGHRQLADILETPVATGEIEATRWGFLTLLERRAADILQADAAVAGGITEWLKIAHHAASYGIPLAPHWFADLHVHLVAATPNAIWVEYFVGTSILNIMRLFRTTLEVKDGFISLPQRPGLGIELDDEAVERFALEPWQ